jgi:hypothetical protein
VISPGRREFYLWQVLGICVFVVAFFLPAIRTDPASPALKGWECATITLSSVIRAETWRSLSFLAALSGLINPLMALLLGFSLIPPLRRSRALGWVRVLLAVLVPLFMVATWIFLGVAHLRPLIGHVLWIAGGLIIIVVDRCVARPVPA